MAFSLTPATLVVNGSPPPSINKENAVAATLTFGGSAHACKVKGHGNWTWSQSKQPYNIKLDTATELLGMAADKDWVLLANVSDRSFVNTALAMNLGRQVSKWTPDYRFIDLTLNGKYVGIYQLMEKVKLGKDRLNEPKVDTSHPGSGLTGTYLMEINDQHHGPPPFVTQHGVSIVWDDPDMDPPVPAQQKYIEDWIQNFENALYAPDAFTRKSNRYWDMIDGTSFATWYLIEELASNQDSNFSGSCKLYKTQDGAKPGVLIMGPLWDFDISFGNMVNISHDPNQFFTRTSNSRWLIRMFEDPIFINEVKSVWRNLKAIIGTNGTHLDAIIDAITIVLSQSMKKDEQQWHYSYNAVGNWSYAPINYQAYPTKKDWIRARINFLDQHYL